MIRKYQKGDLIMANDYEGIVIGYTVPSSKIIIRHLCASNLGPWDCFERRYNESEVKPVSSWKRFLRKMFPSYLTVHDYGFTNYHD